MMIRILVCVCLFSLSLHGMAAVNGPHEASFFKRFVRNMDRSNPASYRVYLSGNAIQKRLKRIPADARKKGRSPIVSLFYRRGVGQRIVVQHVDSVFRNMFSLYNKYLNLTGAYIKKKGRTWKEFTRGYQMRILRVTAYSYQLRISRKGSSSGTFGIFTVSRSSWVITQARFYSRGSLIYSVKNSYQRYGRYFLPRRMAIRAYRRGRVKNVSVIAFVNYRLNLRIPDSIFFHD